MRILTRIALGALHIRVHGFFIVTFLMLSFTAQGQWLDWQDITSTNLVLSSVANSDDEEKDISAGDLNNDGYTDVIVVRKEPFSASTEPPKSDLLLINENGVLVDRTNEFAPEFISNPSFARDVLIHDLDGDGWLDVVVANTFNQQPIYYRNQGNNGNGDWLGLVDESSSRFPIMSDGPTLLCAVWAGDVTGDGFDDVYFVNYAQNGTAKDYLFINDGSGVFTDESQARLGDLRNSAFGTAVEIYDMDNDGDNDIVKTSVLFQVAPWNTQGLFLLYNDGTGNFNNWQKISSTNASYMFNVIDINQDGKLDVYVVDDAIDYQMIAGNITPNSNINYTSTNINSTRITGFGGNVHSADLDVDGDIEFAIADVDVDIPPCTSDRTFAIMQNDNGNIIDPYTNGNQFWEGNSYDFCFLDVNNDGLQDIFIGRCSGYNLLLNDNCELATGGADFDLDGITDACDECPTNPDPNCVEDPEFPTVDPNLNIARKWNEMLLESIRKDFARPTVHARNLFHSSVAMWDAWATFHTPACHYLLGNTVNGFACDFSDFASNLPPEESTETALSYAMYRLLSHRFQNSPEGDLLQQGYDNLMTELGYDINLSSVDYSDGDPVKLGNYIAQCMINYGLQDGSNEQNDYGNTAYAPVNDPLIIDNPGNPTINDYNRWQPLTLDLFIDQSGNIIPGSTPDFLSPEWGVVSSFALSDSDLTINQRDGYDYHVYHDPGTPPNTDLNGGAQTEDYLWGVAMVGIWSSHLDPTDNVMWDISPGVSGNSTALPTNFSNYDTFYDQMNGGTASTGHSVNPVTGQPYAPNMVPRGDYARVLAEFWADGPDSETPPGHWFSILNYVADHPEFEKRFEGQGDILPETEWYVKSYFGMGGAMHDAAVSAWGIKGWYDYIRPISALRAAADLGQSTDAGADNYHPAGIPLIPGQFETIETGDSLAGAANEHVGKIKMLAWRGHDAINNVDSDVAGVGWIRVEDWVPYQRPSFVTPPFAGYVSGHSTFSRAAAEYLTKITGDAYFPGGMGTFMATQNEFLVFEDGPSMDIELQWATYHDAADQSGLSRIWGGIHPPADDIPGRLIGIQIGLDAFDKLKTYFIDEDEDGVCDPDDICADFDDSLIGTSCDDGDICTTGETYDENCQCSGGVDIGDSDGDGVCDAEDVCPDFDDNLIGMPCDDGDICTIGEIYDENCGCSGGQYVGDSDEDGVCDLEDQCPNFDDNLIGTPCDDGDPCTAGEIYDANCGCSGGIDVGDSDEDGICDALDQCPNFDDNLIGMPCDDGDICTVGEIYDENCGCSGGQDVGDSDEDGVCDLEDQCPNFDDNLIGMPCDDGDPCTEGELYDANCGCSGGIDVGDSDEDGICDALDQCPDFDDNLIGMPCDDGDICTIGEIYDPNCGCSGGQYVGDSDEDGICDALDQCPNFDDNLIGMPCDDGDICTIGEIYDENCGCSGGQYVGDSDEDGVCDLEDQCPNFDDNLIGMPCDDGDPCTEGELYDANCGCS
ncbi:MAG: FG-GAP-like repeat-containing protein, partial [Bacteroidota bacterium]